MTTEDPICYSIVLLTGDNPNDPSGENDDDDALATSTVSEEALPVRQMIRSTVLNLNAATDSDDDDTLATSYVPEAVAARRTRIRSTVLSLSATADGDDDDDATLAANLSEAALTARRQMIRSTVLSLGATADGDGHAAPATCMVSEAVARRQMIRSTVLSLGATADGDGHAALALAAPAAQLPCPYPRMLRRILLPRAYSRRFRCCCLCHTHRRCRCHLPLAKFSRSRQTTQNSLTRGGKHSQRRAGVALSLCA